MKMTQDPKQWVLPTGDYANTRYSKLNQINKDNVQQAAGHGHSPLACCAAMKAGRW